MDSIDYGKPIAFKRGPEVERCVVILPADKQGVVIIKSMSGNYAMATHDGRVFDLLGRINTIDIINI